MEKRIILLNGPSSSGKSTLAKALRQEILQDRGEDYAVVSIDDFLRMTRDQTIYEDDVFEISRAMGEKVLALLQDHPGVIIDHVITSRRIFEQLAEMLDGHHLHLIRITCPLEVLRKREVERKNRCLGSAEASDAYLYPSQGYKLTLDTHAMSPQECAKQILETIHGT